MFDLGWLPVKVTNLPGLEHRETRGALQFPGLSRRSRLCPSYSLQKHETQLLELGVGQFRTYFQHSKFSTRNDGISATFYSPLNAAITAANLDALCAKWHTWGRRDRESLLCWAVIIVGVIVCFAAFPYSTRSHSDAKYRPMGASKNVSVVESSVSEERQISRGQAIEAWLIQRFGRTSFERIQLHHIIRIWGDNTHALSFFWRPFREVWHFTSWNRIDRGRRCEFFGERLSRIFCCKGYLERLVEFRRSSHLYKRNPSPLIQTELVNCCIQRLLRLSPIEAGLHYGLLRGSGRGNHLLPLEYSHTRIDGYTNEGQYGNKQRARLWWPLSSRLSDSLLRVSIP